MEPGDVLRDPYCDFCDSAPPVGAILIEPSEGPAICESCVEMCWRSIAIAKEEQAAQSARTTVPIKELH